MPPRAALLLAGLLPLVAACGGRPAPVLTAQEAYQRLPDEVGGFRKSRPERGAGDTVVARYAHPSQAAATVHALSPGARRDGGDGSESPEVGEAIELFARAVAVDAASRRDTVTLRHFSARAAEAGPSARCLDAQMRGELPYRQLGCATRLDRRVFVVMLLAPDAADGRRGLRDPLLAVTMRMIGALSNTPMEPVPAADLDLPPPPPAAEAPPPRRAPAPAPRRPRPAGSGPTWKT